jgi:hypothetical protein
LAVYLGAKPKVVIAILNAGSRAVAPYYTIRPLIGAHPAIRLRYNNPAVFDPESRGISISQRGFARDKRREQDDDKGPHDDLLVWVVRPINLVQAYDASPGYSDRFLTGHF